MSKNKSMVTKLHIKKGDLVRIIAGNARGREGKVKEILKSKYRAIVEGINLRKKHIKPSAKNPNGGIIEKETSIHLSNIMLFTKTNQITRVGRKKDKNGKLQRYSKKTNEFI